jgi:Uncharacterised nucleotidyltransferase
MVRPANRTPEVQLLLCCARVQLSDSVNAQIRSLLHGKIDWTLWLAKVDEHRLIPLAYRALTAVSPELVPAEVLDQLKTASHNLAFRNLRLTHNLLTLLRDLKAGGFEAIVLKGPVVAQLVYRDLKLRSFGDLDIWVKPTDYLPVKRFLIRQGYSRAEEFWLPHLWQEEQHNLEQGELSLINPDGDAAIDLHGRLVAGFLFSVKANFEQFWHDRQAVALGGSNVISLCPEDLLLHLCIHGGKEQWHRLSWVVDIAELINTHPDLNWEELFLKASQYGVERMLLLGLCLAENLVQANLPPVISLRVVMRYKQDALLRALEQAVVESVSQTVPYQNLFFDGQRIWFHLALLGSFSERFVYVGSAIKAYLINPIVRIFRPTTHDYKMVELPNSLAFAYSGLRPLRLLSKLGRSVWAKFQC